MAANVQIDITLPAAPQQVIPLAQRVVTITVNGQPQPTVTLQIVEGQPAPTAVPPFPIDPDAKLTASVTEVLTNGAQSDPCTSAEVVPSSLVQAIAADPAGFSFKVSAIPA